MCISSPILPMAQMPPSFILPPQRQTNPVCSSVCTLHLQDPPTSTAVSRKQGRNEPAVTWPPNLDPPNTSSTSEEEVSLDSVLEGANMDHVHPVSAVERQPSLTLYSVTASLSIFRPRHQIWRVQVSLAPVWLVNRYGLSYTVCLLQSLSLSFLTK